MDIQVSSQSEQGQSPLRHCAPGSRFRLSVRTSMLAEFRDPEGALGAFELSQRFTTVGSLCSALQRLPGIQFELARDSFWSLGPNRFTFKARAFEITAPHGDVRIAPVEAGAVYRETEDLLRLVIENLIPKWQNRERSRFYRV